MAFILDASVVLIVLFCIWNGWRRGFFRSLRRLIAFVLAVLVAVLLSGPLAEVLYDSAIAPSVQKTLVETIQDEGADTIEEQMDRALSQFPGYVRNLLANQGITSGRKMAEKVHTATAGTVEETAQRIDETLVAPMVVPLLRMVLFSVVFTVASVVISLLLRLVDKVFDLPLLRGLNRTLGVIPGALNGVLCALLLATVAQIMAAAGTADSLISTGTIADTTLLEWLVGVNPLGDALQELITVTI